MNKSIKTNSILNVFKQLCVILFPLITFPYASRVLGVYNYGKVAFGSSLISYIALVASLGVVEYAMREASKVRNDKAEFQKIVNQIFSINVISTIVAYSILFVLMLTCKKLRGYELLLIIQSISIIFTTIGTDWINTAFEDYLYITIRYIVCNVISLILMFVFVKSKNDYIFYSFTSISTNIFANISNIFYIRRKYKIHISFTIKIDWKRHFKPIIILFGSTVASLVYINSDVLMLGVMADEKSVGLYSAAAKVYSVIKQVLNSALAVTIPRISNNINNKIDNNKMLFNIRAVSILVLLPATVGLFMISDKVILFLSGMEYLKAGNILKILSVALFFATSGCYYISVIMIPYGKEKWIFIGTLISATVNIALNFILIPICGNIAAAVTTVISEAIMLTIGIIKTWNIIKPHYLKVYIVSIVNSLVVAIISLLVDRISINFIYKLIATVMLSILGVAIVIALFYGKKVLYIINAKKR